MIEIALAHSWNRYLDLFEEQQDIYFREEYVKLYETPQERGCCLVAREGENIMIFPFLARSFEYEGKSFYDFETAYGYGGPLFNTTNEYFIQRALVSSEQFLKQEGFICGFVRFHTLIENYKYCAQESVQFDRLTVSMDLTPSQEDIWQKQIHSKNRNVIKKGEKSGLSFVADYDYKYISDFIRLYNSTMRRIGADEFYFFNQSYYDSFIRDIKNSFLGIVLLGEKVISAAIFMYNGRYGHYHLSGSDHDYLYCSPNNFMLYSAALELKKQGVEVFHLGGGTSSSEDDSLFAFKSKFSPYRHQFYLGKFIFNRPLYEVICRDWSIKNPEKVEKYNRYLLKYKY